MLVSWPGVGQGAQVPVATVGGWRSRAFQVISGVDEASVAEERGGLGQGGWKEARQHTRRRQAERLLQKGGGPEKKVVGGSEGRSRKKREQSARERERGSRSPKGEKDGEWVAR